MKYRIVEEFDELNHPINYALQYGFWIFWFTVASYSEFQYALDAIHRLRGMKRIVFAE